MKYHLIHMSGALQGRTLIFEKSVVIIGRDPGCDVRFPAEKWPSMPVQFAQIVTDERGACAIQYLVSPDSPEFGTIRLNGVPVTRPSEALSSETEILFGNNGPALYFRTGIPTVGATNLPQQVRVLAHLSMLSGADAGRKFELTSPGPFRIGRNANMEIALNPIGDMLVSGRHAIIEMNDYNQWMLTDTSRHGTYVNNRAIGTATVLRNDDIISLGKKGPQAHFTIEREPVFVSVTQDNVTVVPGQYDAPMEVSPYQETQLPTDQTLPSVPTLPPADSEEETPCPVGAAPIIPEPVMPTMPAAEPMPATPIPMPVVEPTPQPDVIPVTPAARTGAPGFHPKVERMIPGIRKIRTRRLKSGRLVAIVAVTAIVLFIIVFWVFKLTGSDKPVKPAPSVKPIATTAKTSAPPPPPTSVKPAATPKAVVTPAPTPPPATAVNVPGPLFAPPDLDLTVTLPSPEWKIMGKRIDENSKISIYNIATPSGKIINITTIPSEKSVDACYSNLAKKLDAKGSAYKRYDKVFYYYGNNLHNYIVALQRPNDTIILICACETTPLVDPGKAEVEDFINLATASK